MSKRSVPKRLKSSYLAGRRIARADGWVNVIRSYQDKIAVANGCWYDVSEADLWVDFFSGFLHHSKGEWAGKPFVLDDWQQAEWIRPLFGWRRKDGTRRYRRGYVGLPKKQGKSTVASGIAIGLAVNDQEGGAEVYTAATQKEQAAIVWKEAASMVRRSSELHEILQVHDHNKTIVYRDTESIIRALSADVEGAEGLNIHGLIMDELHAWKDRRFWDALIYGGSARRQPLFLSITTAGQSLNSIGYEEYTYAKKVVAGDVDDWEYFALIYEADPDDDWTKPATWRKANPAIGTILEESAFKREVDEALESPAKKAAFCQYRLNMWNWAATPWISMDKWDACEDSTLTLENMVV